MEFQSNPKNLAQTQLLIKFLIILEKAYDEEREVILKIRNKEKKNF